jgi:hypothetical protein
MNFFRTIGIYALIGDNSGNWVAVNRNYKPIGFTSTSLENYADYPISHRFSRLTKSFREAISWDGKGGNDTTIYLYTSYNHPLKSPENMASYLKRLELLFLRKVA